MESHIDPYKRVAYCPMCQETPQRPSNRDSLNLVVPVPRICPSCQAKNSALMAEIKSAEKVKVQKIPFGQSARPKEEHQKSLLNLTNRNKAKANRSKNQPP